MPVIDMQPGEELDQVTEGNGYVGFLDVLGMRGRWLRQEPRQIVEAFESWYSLVTAVDSTTGIATLDYIPEVAIPPATGSKPPRLTTHVWAFSDTVAVLLDTHGLATPELTQRLSNALAELFVAALDKELLLRGAVAFGRFYRGKGGRILIGPAVDEAAEWYDKADWAGIHLTPSAGRSVVPGGLPGQPTISTAGQFVHYPVPLKSGGVVPAWALAWPLFGSDRLTPIIDHQFFQTPVSPSLERKRQNTLAFRAQVLEDWPRFRPA